MRERLVILTLLVCAALSVAYAQQLEWSVDMEAMFQNREGGDEQTPDQTFLFTRLSPEVGLSLMDGTHKVMGGVSWYQPMVSNCDGYKVVPTVYYKYEQGPWTAALGMMPRSLMERKAPALLFSDSLNFTTPNLRGALLRHKGKRGYAQLALDWRQMQSPTRREAFNVLIDTHCDIVGPLAVDTWLQINHLAKASKDNEGQGVNDDITLLPMLSLDLARYTSLKSLDLGAGAAVQMQRARDEHKWHTPCRLVVRAHAQWRWLEATEEFSTGKDAFPLYDRFGSQLNLGDPYYRYKTYSRTDLRAHIVSNSFVDLSAVLTYHATDKMTGFWQQLSCRVYIDNALWKHRRDKQRLNAGQLNPIF